MPGPVIAPPLTDVSRRGLEAAIEADSIGARVLGGEMPKERHLDPDAKWAVGGANDPFANTVASSNFDPANADARIAQIVATYDARPTPFLWWRAPFHGPADLAERLERAHVYRVGEGPAMAMDLERLGPRPQPAPGFDVRGVIDETGLRDYVTVLNSEPDPSGASRNTPERIEQQVAYGLEGLPLEPIPMRLVGYAAGRAVATARLSLAGGTAGVYAVNTLEAHRGRGYGAAITHDVLSSGRDLGYRIATLQSSDMGHGIYERLGFEDVFHYTIHVHLPGGARWSPA